MKPSQPTYTIDDLKQAARKMADSSKDFLCYHSSQQSRAVFEKCKQLEDERLFGLRLFCIYLIDDEAVQEDYISYIKSLQKEIDSFSWPET